MSAILFAIVLVALFAVELWWFQWDWMYWDGHPPWLHWPRRRTKKCAAPPSEEKLTL